MPFYEVIRKRSKLGKAKTIATVARRANADTLLKQARAVLRKNGMSGDVKLDVKRVNPKWKKAAVGYTLLSGNETGSAVKVAPSPVFKGDWAMYTRWKGSGGWEYIGTRPTKNLAQGYAEQHMGKYEWKAPNRKRKNSGPTAKAKSAATKAPVRKMNPAKIVKGKKGCKKGGSGVLSSAKRDQIPARYFALPLEGRKTKGKGKGRYPIISWRHAAGAKSRAKAQLNRGKLSKADYRRVAKMADAFLAKYRKSCGKK